ncbi:MAG: radical SAM/SPASM domain-containing protein [Patescibacteria group bacterium]
MNLVEARYHGNRLFNMARYKGLGYTLNYLFNLAIYNSNFFSEKILYPLFPLSVFYPRYIEIEVSTFCNLRCRMCEHTYWQEKNQMMTFVQLKRIVGQFPGLKWIGLTGIGESFLNPDFMKMVKFVKEKNLYLELYDTFFLIDEKFARGLIEAGVDRMIVSIDATTPKTYEKIRVGANFDRVVRNIKSLLSLKKKMKSYYPEITFHYIISKENINEVLPFVSLVKKLMGKENTSILFTGILHEFSEIKGLAVEVPDDLVERVNQKAQKLGIKVAWNRNVPGEKDPRTKCNEWTMPFIFVDGTVVPCCAGNEANKRDYQRKTSMGNVFKTSFKEIWNGPKYMALREMIHDGKTPPACEYCTLYKV